MLFSGFCQPKKSFSKKKKKIAAAAVLMTIQLLGTWIPKRSKLYVCVCVHVVKWWTDRSTIVVVSICSGQVSCYLNVELTPCPTKNNLLN